MPIERWASLKILVVRTKVYKIRIKNKIGGEIMKYIKMKIKDAFVVDLSPIGDSRGFFSRVFCQKGIYSKWFGPESHANQQLLQQG